MNTLEWIQNKSINLLVGIGASTVLILLAVWVYTDGWDLALKHIQQGLYNWH